MKIFEWLAELRYRNSLLYRVGMMHFVLFFLLLVAFFVDSRQVLGINTWIKPMKFCLSIGIYVWTFGWILFDIPGSKTIKKVITWAIAGSMMGEIAIIVYQGARATPSHFNTMTNYDANLFIFMGVFIGINTLAIIGTFILYLIRKVNLDNAYLWALKLAFVIFIVGNWVGGVMIGQMSHSVGVADGGPGVPFANWSMEGGDLRIAHFLGLHSIQIIPFVAYLLLKKTSLPMGTRRMISIALSGVYAALVAYLYLQAMNGIPLFTGS